jgi:hypothetical protein
VARGSGMIWGVSGWEEFAIGVWEVLRVGREGGKGGEVWLERGKRRWSRGKEMLGAGSLKEMG